MKSSSKNFLVAQFGKTVGLKGDLKLHLHTDFPEQFKIGRVFDTLRGKLKIENYNPKRGLIKIVGYNNPEDSKLLTNVKLFSSEDETREYCKLDSGQYFWFDLIGSLIKEANDELGLIKDIQRLPQGDYFLINTSKELIDKGYSKSFLLPYLPNFVTSVDIEKKVIIAIGAKDILEAS